MKIIRDSVVRSILRKWAGAPSLSPAELAERCGLTLAKLTRGQSRLQDEGVIKGIEAIIDWAALGYAFEVSLRVTLDKTIDRAFDEFIDAARGVPEVIEIQTFLGRVDVRLSVIAKDMPDYQKLYRSEILNLPHIAELEALMHVATLKTAQDLPL